MQPPERLDPKVRAIKSSELLELKKELVDQERSETERKLAKKYHHVKFFERIKIERAISKLERKMKSEGEEGGEWEGDLQRVQELKEDLEYVMNFPAGERYVSLLKNATDESSQTHLDSERSRLRALIKRQMKESALVNDADEGKSIKLLGIIPPAAPQAQAAPKAPASRGDKVRSDIKVEKKVAGDVSKSRVKAIEKEVEVEKDDEDDFFLGRNTLHSTILTGSGMRALPSSYSSHPSHACTYTCSSVG